MTTKMLSLGAVIAIAGAGVGAMMLLPQPSGEQSVQSPAHLQTVSLAVENMTCATCPIAVRRAMESVAGVQDVSIDYDGKTATVQFDPARTTVGAIAAASTEAGFPAALFERAS